MIQLKIEAQPSMLLYRYTLYGFFFQVFWIWIFTAIFHSVALYYLPTTVLKLGKLFLKLWVKMCKENNLLGQ